MPKKKRHSSHWRFDSTQVKPEGKPYYTIGEVARLFNVEETQLRYWEQHTPLAPKRASSSGARLYTQEDLKLVERIRYLLLDKGLSLQAISDQLKNGAAVDTDLQIRGKLMTARERIIHLKRLVDQQLQDGESHKE